MLSINPWLVLTSIACLTLCRTAPSSPMPTNTLSKPTSTPSTANPAATAIHPVSNIGGSNGLDDIAVAESLPAWTVTFISVLPLVLLIRWFVVKLYLWREQRRARVAGNVYVEHKRGRDEEAGTARWWKPELSAEDARCEVEAGERRFEMDGEGGRVELGVEEDEVEKGGERGLALQKQKQELTAGEIAKELDASVA